MKDKQLIIIGGGSSIKEGIAQGLWDKLQNKLTFGINYSFNYLQSTAQFYVDLKFYQDEYDNLKKLPLIIGKYHRRMEERPNTIMLKACSEYDSTLTKGVYKASLCGLFTLSVGLFLEPKEIFLLGFDYGSNGGKTNDQFVTHFYQGDINHRGIGKINYYSAKGRANKDFIPYDNHKNINNVSLISAIPTFPKITYAEFFEKLTLDKYNQDELRTEIKTKLKEKGESNV